MRKVLVIAACIFFAKGLHAQSTISIGPTVGFGHSWISNSGVDNKFNPMYNAGLSFIYSTQTHWGFGVDAKYSAEGAKANVEGGTTEINANYIRVPLKAIYFFNKNGNAIRPKVSLGPTFGFLVGDNEAKDALKSFDIGGQLSAGANFRVSPKTWLNADLSYYHGFTEVAENSDSRNRNIGVNVSLMTWAKRMACSASLTAACSS